MVNIRLFVKQSHMNTHMHYIFLPLWRVVVFNEKIVYIHLRFNFRSDIAKDGEVEFVILV